MPHDDAPQSSIDAAAHIPTTDPELWSACLLTSGSTVTVTVEGTGMGFLPMRDMLRYQTSATTSPPTPALRASWPVITPLEVETIAVPMPP